MISVSATDLSNESLLKLLEEAGIEAEIGPEEMGTVIAHLGSYNLFVEAFPDAQVVKVWATMELDPEKHDPEKLMGETNRFNHHFLLVRNFVLQDPNDPTNFRVVWDHDRIIGPEGLTSDVLALMVSRVADIIMRAFSGDQAPADA